MIDDFLQALLQELDSEVTKTAKFTQAGWLLCTVLIHAYINQQNPVEVIETVENMPPFIAMPLGMDQHREGEMLTIAGEGVAEEDLETLAGDSWLNDKVTTNIDWLLLYCPVLRKCWATKNKCPSPEIHVMP
ncbi:hypothetical protein DPMN_135426 [Dreissena polymorpha]|uniref:Uncharacterized protein n=1 Tax=Dreissena polymorpha TaxID=45954 RepID=A0A9D4JFS5_DREPO|nr:hypothetical protein DPMN_135426 [Dreissena polymorpha]